MNLLRKFCELFWQETNPCGVKCIIWGGASYIVFIVFICKLYFLKGRLEKKLQVQTEVGIPHHLFSPIQELGVTLSCQQHQRGVGGSAPTQSPQKLCY